MNLKSNIHKRKVLHCLLIIQLIAANTLSSFLFSQTAKAQSQSHQSTKNTDSTSAQSTSTASVVEKINSFEITVTNPQELDDLFLLTRKIMSSEALYRFLNLKFKEQLTISEELQKKYNWPEKTKGLSESQIVFMLYALPEYRVLLHEYLSRITNKNAKDPENKEFRKNMIEKFNSLMKADLFLAKIKELSDPQNSLTILDNNGKPGFSDVSIHFNHPLQMDPTDKESTVPAEDLEKIVNDFISGAKHNIMGNVFEFNLVSIAENLIKKSNAGLSVVMGIDKNTTALGKNNKTVTAMLQSQAEKNNNFALTLVDPAGLNHQKILIRDYGTPDAAVLILSGNFTQSCIGKLGDAVDYLNDPTVSEIDKIKLMKKSKPNANHAVFLKGGLVAAVAHHELSKTLIEKLKGRSQYPISGSYTFLGDKFDGFKERSEMTLAFSPNGGMGSINKTLFVPLIMKSGGLSMMMQFAMSSPDVLKALIESATNGSTDLNKFDFRFTGDPAFSLREWAIPLLMSGMQRDENKVYSNNPDSPLKDIAENLKKSIRINPKHFGEFNVKIKNAEGKEENVKLTVKLHHKVMIFPKIKAVVVGTSFNVSDAAESNQEQVAIFKNHPIIKKTEGAFYFLFYENGTMAVATKAELRNKFKDTELDPVDPESMAIKKANEKTKAPMCLNVFFK